VGWRPDSGTVDPDLALIFGSESCRCERRHEGGEGLAMRPPRVRFKIWVLMVAVVLTALVSSAVVHTRRTAAHRAMLASRLINQQITERGAMASYQNARLTREVAEIAVVEYERAIIKQDRLVWSNRMLRKGYESLGRNISEQLPSRQADFNIEQAQTRLDVLEKFTKDKTIEELQSEVVRAKAAELAKKAILGWEQARLKAIMAELGR
jgi:hypothetical protein